MQLFSLRGSYLLSCLYPPVYARGGGGGGGVYSIYPWGGGGGSAPHTLTLIKTKIADFPTLFKTEF